MTAKEKFLQSIRDKIKVLENAYNANKDLPADVFENLYRMNEGAEVIKIKASKQVADNGSIKQVGSYGDYKKIIIHILKEENKGLKKPEIINAFKEMVSTPNDT